MTDEPTTPAYAEALRRVESSGPRPLSAVEADRILDERLAALGVQPPAGGPLAVLRARLVAERDRARRSSAASRREDVGLAQSGIAAGLDIAIALLDHLPAQGTAGKPADGTLRDRYAEALREFLGDGPWDVVAQRAADALMAVRDTEVAQLRAQVETWREHHRHTEAHLHRVEDVRDGAIRHRDELAAENDQLLARVAELEQHHATLCALVDERSKIARSARARVFELEIRADTAQARLQLCRMALTRDGYFTDDEIGPDIAPRITERLAKAHEAEDAVARVRQAARELNRNYPALKPGDKILAALDAAHTPEAGRG